MMLEMKLEMMLDMEKQWSRIIANFESIIADLQEVRCQGRQEQAIRLRYIVNFLGLGMTPAMLHLAAQLAPMPGAGSEAKDGN